MQIIYYASDDTMGDTSAENCLAYRAWALDELEAEYPEHDIEVTAEPRLEPVWTDDEARHEEIHAFCARLWDRCPWDWID